MELMTKELEKLFPPLYSTENMRAEDVRVIAKYFISSTNWTFYATEYDPKDRLLWGYIKFIEDELTFISLDELKEIKGPFGCRVERDIFLGEHTLAEAMEKQL